MVVRFEYGMERHTFCLDYNVCTCNGQNENWTVLSGTQEIPSTLLVQIAGLNWCSSTVHAMYLVKMWSAPGMEINYQLLTCKMTPILIFSWL